MSTRARCHWGLGCNSNRSRALPRLGLSASSYNFKRVTRPGACPPVRCRRWCRYRLVRSRPQPTRSAKRHLSCGSLGPRPVPGSALRLSDQLSAAGASRPRRTAVTVVLDRNESVVERLQRIHGPDRLRVATGRDLHHLIEIAVVDLSVSADGNEVATHQVFHRGAVEAVDQKHHVLLHLICMFQIVEEPLDRHIGYGE